MIDLEETKWVTRYSHSVSANNPFFLFKPLPDGFTSLIRFRITSPYIYNVPKYAGRLLILNNNPSYVITYRNIYLNDERLWYFPVAAFSLKFIPTKYLPLFPLLVKEYLVPVEDIPVEDLRALNGS